MGAHLVRMGALGTYSSVTKVNCTSPGATIIHMNPIWVSPSYSGPPHPKKGGREKNM